MALIRKLFSLDRPDVSPVLAGPKFIAGFGDSDLPPPHQMPVETIYKSRGKALRLDASWLAELIDSTSSAPSPLSTPDQVRHLWIMVSSIAQDEPLVPIIKHQFESPGIMGDPAKILLGRIGLVKPKYMPVSTAHLLIASITKVVDMKPSRTTWVVRTYFRFSRIFFAGA